MSKWRHCSVISFVCHKAGLGEAALSLAAGGVGDSERNLRKDRYINQVASEMPHLGCHNSSASPKPYFRRGQIPQVSFAAAHSTQC